MDSDKPAESGERIHCYRCKYFQVTWDKHMPYGCKKIGFKSQVIPSLEVFRTSGSHCLHFEKKTRRF